MTETLENRNFNKSYTNFCVLIDLFLKLSVEFEKIEHSIFDLFLKIKQNPSNFDIKMFEKTQMNNTF